MSELGDLLEALHGPIPRYESLHARVRQWVHFDRQSMAFRRDAEEGGATIVTVAAASDAPERPEELVTVAEVWLADARARVEYAGGPRSGEVVIARGQTWWRSAGPLGAITNDGDDDAERMSTSI